MTATPMSIIKSNAAVGLMALFILLASWLVTEARMRSYINYPWLEDRDAVLGLLDTIEARTRRLESEVEKLRTLIPQGHGNERNEE